MKRTVLAPLTVLAGIVGLMFLMSINFFSPLIQFIHSGNITPLQTLACLAFTVAGFAASIFLLNILCSYFVPRMATASDGSGVTRQPEQEEDHQVR
jgi:hypothetical protein